MNIALWIVQILLSVTFIWAGATKLLDPAQLPWPWISENPGLVKLTAVFDLLAGIGLVLPALLRIQPKLTIYAAYGAIALMTAAIIFHVSRGEGSQTGFNIFVVLAAAFVAWGKRQ